MEQFTVYADTNIARANADAGYSRGMYRSTRLPPADSLHGFAKVVNNITRRR